MIANQLAVRCPGRLAIVHRVVCDALRVTGKHVGHIDLEVSIPITGEGDISTVR